MDTASGGQLRPTILNEWGECTEKFKAVDLNNDFISKLQKNDPTVTAIRATLANWGRVKDWGVAGRAVGASVHLKHLSLGFYSEPSDTADILQSFFTGLAFNRSIESLELTLNHGDGYAKSQRYDDDAIKGIDDAYTKLAPFFSENHHLVCITFDMSTEGFVSRTLAQLIQSSPFIQSAMIDCNHACKSSRGIERILEAVCRNQTLEHISAKSLPLSEDICGEIQNMLSNDNCALKSLAFEDQAIGRNHACVASIARGFNQNHSLERFRLTAYESDFGNDDDWTSFFRSMQSSSFRELELYGIIKSDSVMKALSNCLMSNREVRVLNLGWYYSLTSDGWNYFANMLSSHTAIKDVDVLAAGINALLTLTDSLPRAIVLNPRLRRVQLPVRTLHELRIVASALESPNSSLEELAIDYQPGFRQPASNTEVTAVLALSLQMNSMLKRLHHKSCYQSGLADLDWPILLTLLCDTSSIEATMHSNHTLELLSSNKTAVPLEISSLMRMNQNPNKRDVAISKIVQHHSFETMDFVPTSLPTVLSLVGKTNVNHTLSVLYEILRKVPHVMQKETRKRKAERQD
eukprot:scaffold48279_cov50-Cyclotella_meneghiniana.AAC.3